MAGAERVAVTGGTGRLGGRVAQRLAGAGVPQRLLVRDPSRAPRLPGARVVRAEHADADAVAQALEGVATVLMVSGAEAPDRVQQHQTFLDAAAAAGVQHVVYTSFAGASADATFTLARDHWATEEHLRGTGTAWTALRDNLYLDVLPFLVGDDGAIRGPAGAGRVAAVAIDDVADVAAAVLLDPGSYAGQVLELTGPRALTLAEVADVLTTATGRPVRYVEETLAEAYASRGRYGVPTWQVDAWVSTYTAIAAGELERTTDDVRRVTGHPPRSLADVLG